MNTEKLLNDNGIKFYCPSPGHYKIKSDKNITIMFYPKSMVIIWKRSKKDYQHRFKNDDPQKIIDKLKSIY